MHAADFWAQAGHAVTVLFTQGRVSQNKTIDYWIDFYKEKGITMLCAAELPRVHAPTPALRWSYQGYRALAELPPFDFVHSSECGASPYYALMAKRNLGQFGSSTFCIKTSSPHLWSRQGNEATINLDTGLVICAAERYCVEKADLVISPSQHMLQWMGTHGYSLPKNVCVHPNVMPLSAMRSPQPSRHPVKEVKELIFFGRLEPRKGLLLFAEALQLMHKSSDLDCRVVFLGKKIDDFDFDALLATLKRDLPFNFRAIHNFNATQAVSYLTGPGRLAVIPSLLDNSPFTVYESLTNGILFSAADVGGVAELIHPDDRQRTLFAPNPVALARTLTRIITLGTSAGRLSFDPSKSLAIWDKFHRLPDKKKLGGETVRVEPVKERPEWFEIVVQSDLPYPVILEEALQQLKSAKQPYVVLRSDRLKLRNAEVDELVRIASTVNSDVIVPATRLQGNGALLVNFEPSIWTKPEFSRLECPLLVGGVEQLTSILTTMLSFKSMYSTNFDTIVAVACREAGNIRIIPEPFGIFSGAPDRKVSRTQRSRQFEYLAVGLSADVGNVLRIYGALSDERARVLTAQPILRNTMRLLKLLQRMEGQLVADSTATGDVQSSSVENWRRRFLVWMRRRGFGNTHRASKSMGWISAAVRRKRERQYVVDSVD
jgi:glycosyltransferase involved in cell wall biosynthesis